MLALLLLLTLFLLVFVISYWSMHLYPRLRPFRYSHHTEQQLPLACGSSQMQTLASQYQLHGVVARCETDIERVDAMLNWVYDRWEPQPGHSAGTGNPLEILARAQNGERFGRSDYVTVLAYALQAIEVPTRLLELHTRDSHWRPWGGHYRGLEVFLRDRHCWCWLDAQHDAIIINKETFCSALDIKDAMLDRDNRLEMLSTLGVVDIDSYLKGLAPFLDVLITRPLGQQRRIALVPPQLSFPRRHHWLGPTLYDQLCLSREVFYASHPVSQVLPTPIRRPKFYTHPVSA